MILVLSTAVAVFDSKNYPSISNVLVVLDERHDDIMIRVKYVCSFYSAIPAENATFPAICCCSSIVILCFILVLLLLEATSC